MKITCGKVCYPWVVIGEFEDGYSYEMPGNDIGDCIAKLDKLTAKHGDLIWYGGLNDEDYVDGEYVGSDNKLMSSRQIRGAQAGWDEKQNPYSGSSYNTQYYTGEDVVGEVKFASDVRTFRNKRNQNKYLETKKYNDGHTVSRGYMRYEDAEGNEKRNYMGSRSNRGRWHRMNQGTLNEVVKDDYEEV